MADFTGKIVGIAVGILVAAIMLPLAFSQLADATWGNTSSSVVLMATVLLPILAVVAIAMYFYSRE